MTDFTKRIKRIARAVGDIVFTVKCPYCSRVIGRNEFACGDCRKKMPDTPIISYANGGYKTASPFPYDGIFAKAVKDFKFRGNGAYSRLLAVVLAETIKKVYGENPAELVTCVPMHKNNLKARGYNQSHLLARECAEILKIPYVECLEKHKENRLQHTLHGRERIENVRGVYRVIDKSCIEGKSILIIDDIITTGSTLGECCRVLKKAKCGRISCAALCAVAVK